MPPGPGVSIDEYNRKQKARIQAQQSNMPKTGKPKTTAQQAASAASTTAKKRGSDKTATGAAELKRRRVAAVPGAPAPDPDNDPQGGDAEEEEDDDDDDGRVKPKNPAWVAALWHIDLGAGSKTREALGYTDFYHQVRGLVRELTEYVDHTAILTYGINFHREQAADRPGRVTLTCNDDAVAEELWPQWLKYIRGLEAHLDYLADNPPLIAIIGEYVTGVAFKVRSDDLGRLSSSIISLCNLDDPDRIIAVKENRGWEDSRTARLLCPLRYLPQFEADPARFCRHVRSRLVRMFSTDYPSFFYDMSLVDESDAKLGLLRGPALVNCFKSTMTGKSSVYNNGGRARRGQKSVAEEYKIHSVRLYNIIWVALLARTALSDHDWTDTYGKFWKAEDLVFSIMEIAFNFPEWHADLIKWWNREIFADEEDLDSDAERDLQGSAFHVIMAQKTRALAVTDDDNDEDDNNGDEDEDSDNNDGPSGSGSGSGSSHIGKVATA